MKHLLLALAITFAALSIVPPAEATDGYSRHRTYSGRRYYSRSYAPRYYSYRPRTYSYYRPYYVPRYYAPSYPRYYPPAYTVARQYTILISASPYGPWTVAHTCSASGLGFYVNQFQAAGWYVRYR